jgi:hypothetical protein
MSAAAGTRVLAEYRDEIAYPDEVVQYGGQVLVIALGIPDGSLSRRHWGSEPCRRGGRIPDERKHRTSPGRPSPPQGIVLRTSPQIKSLIRGG